MMISKTWQDIAKQSDDGIHSTAFRAVCDGDVDALKQLELRDEDLLTTDGDGKSLLHVAVQYGLSTMVDHLLTIPNVDVNARATNKWSVLHQAALGGHLAIVKALVDLKQVDINCCDKSGMSALYVAIRGRTLERLKPSIGKLAAEDEQLETIRYLISNGADIHATTKLMSTILHGTAMAGFCDIARLLIDANVDLNAQREGGETAIYFSTFLGHYEMTRILTEAGADIHVLDKKGNSLLHAAASGGNVDIMNMLIGLFDINVLNNANCSAIYNAASKRHIDMFKMLIDAGANVQIRSADDSTLLHYAAVGGNSDIFNILIDLIDYNLCNECGITALHIASIYGHTEILRILIDREIDVNCRTKLEDGHYTALHYAAKYGHPEIMKVLIDHGANIYSRSLGGYTVLHWAASSGSVDTLTVCSHLLDIDASDFWSTTPFYLAASVGHIAVMKELIDLGANIHTVTVFGNNALHISTHADVETMKMLLDLGEYDINARNNSQRTVLVKVAYDGDVDMARLLVGANVDYNLKDCYDWSPICAATSRGHIDLVRFLIPIVGIDDESENGRTLLHAAANGGHIKIIKILIKAGANLEVRDSVGFTVLHAAVHGGQAETVKFLLNKKKLDIHVRSLNGYTLFHSAVFRGNTATEMLQILSDKLDVNICDNVGQSPLHLAVAKDYVECVKFFIEAGADVNGRNKFGRSALHTATSAGHIDCIKLLLDANADINSCDNRGSSVLLTAIDRGHGDIAMLLINRGALIPRGAHGYNVFKHIAETNQIDVMKYIIDARRSAPAAQEWAYSALSIAAECGNVNMLEELLRCGVPLPPSNDPRRRYISQFGTTCENDYIVDMINITRK